MKLGFKYRWVCKFIIFSFSFNLIIFYYSYFSHNVKYKKNYILPIEVSLTEENNEIREKEFNFDNEKIPILVLTCNRPFYLEKTLSYILKYHPDKNNIHSSRFPIYLSQACENDKIKDLAKKWQIYVYSYLYYTPDIEYIKKRADFHDFMLDTEKQMQYCRISDHYRTALNWVFGNHINKENTVQVYSVSNNSLEHYKSVIIFEDDLEISSDTFEYFSALYRLLRKDNSLYCISAWNDHGQEYRINKSAPEQLYRTDFFSGLGWMMLKSLWLELEPGWSECFWDEYMRKTISRKNRHCIRPEISRSRTFGILGVSNSQFYDTHLKYQYINRVFVNFSQLDLSYLEVRNFNKHWIDSIFINTSEKSLKDLSVLKMKDKSIRLKYSSFKEYYAIAELFNLLPDVKFGVPRTSYQGVVTIIYDFTRIYIYPALLKP